MSYGLTATSPLFNGITLDADYEALQSGGERTLARSSAIPHGSNGQWNSYDFIPALFVQLSVGDWVGVTHYNGKFAYISNLTSLTVIDAVLAGNLPNPIGYGAVTYNSSGRKTWVASTASMAVTGYYQLNSVTTITSSAQWVLPITTRSIWRPLGPNSVYEVYTLHRDTSTTYTLRPLIMNQQPLSGSYTVDEHTRFFVAD